MSALSVVSNPGPTRPLGSVSSSVSGSTGVSVGPAHTGVHLHGRTRSNSARLATRQCYTRAKSAKSGVQRVTCPHTAVCRRVNGRETALPRSTGEARTGPGARGEPRRLEPWVHAPETRWLNRCDVVEQVAALLLIPDLPGREPRVQHGIARPRRHQAPVDLLPRQHHLEAPARPIADGRHEPPQGHPERRHCS